MIRLSYKITQDYFLINALMRPALRWHLLKPAYLSSPRFFFARHCVGRRDRKSTRLNSSHSQISYAVFCLKKNRLQSIDLVGRLRLYRLAGLLRARHRVGARCRECGSGEGESGDQREAVRFRGHGASPSLVRVREHRLVIILRPYDELPRSRIRAACGSVRDRADDQPAGEPVLTTNSNRADGVRLDP